MKKVKRMCREFLFRRHKIEEHVFLSCKPFCFTLTVILFPPFLLLPHFSFIYCHCFLLHTLQDIEWERHETLSERTKNSNVASSSHFYFPGVAFVVPKEVSFCLHSASILPSFSFILWSLVLSFYSDFDVIPFASLFLSLIPPLIPSKGFS